MMPAFTYLYEEHLISQQNKNEAAFMARFEKEQPRLENAHILLNPYFINPLAALILFTTDQAEEVTLTIHGKRNMREDINHVFPKGTSHIIPVIALYEDFANKVSIRLSNGAEQHFTITTGILPPEVHRCLNISTSLDYFGTDLMFLSPAGKNFPVAFDYSGDVRWTLTINTMFSLARLENGNILTGSHRFCELLYYTAGLVELSLIGKIYKEYRMPGYAHHDAFAMPDGNILALTQDPTRNTVEDMVVLLDKNTGAILRTWDYTDILPQDIAGSGSQDAHDWIHNNAVWYDEKTHSIMASARHLDILFNFDFETGKLKWILGDPECWPKEMVDKYFFTPVGDLENFEWEYEPHSCRLCPNGDVMVFDNGQYRSKIKEKYIENKDNYSRGVRYRINTDTMEIEQIWQYGKERGQAFFSPYICNVEQYADGHYLIHSGGICFKDGYATKELGAMHEEDPTAKLSSITVEQKDNVVLYELETDYNFYRARRLTPYHAGDNLVLGTSVILGEFAATPTFSTIPDVEEVFTLPDASCKISLIEEEDKIFFQGTFEHGTLVMLVLEGEENTYGYFINTAAMAHIAMCSSAFMEHDSRIVKKTITRHGLSGALKVKLIINDTKYQTGITLYC